MTLRDGGPATKEEVVGRFWKALEGVADEIQDTKLKATGTTIHDINMLSSNLESESYLARRDGDGWEVARWAARTERVKCQRYRLRLLGAGVCPAEAQRRSETEYK
jgi:hypothetical protein